MSGIDLAALGTACLAFLVAAGAPGPATLATAATAMALGRRAALAMGAGLSVGLGLWGLVAAAGLGAVLETSAWAMTAVRVAGGLYLLYLAWRAARAALADAVEARAAAPAGAGRLALRGLLLNATNPKAVLAWMAVLSLGLPQGAGAVQLWSTAAACALVGAGVYAAYALAFSRPLMRAGYARARRGIEAGTALLFGLAGARLIAGRAAEAP